MKNEPAFPLQIENETQAGASFRGLTKLEAAAFMAMQGMLANSESKVRFWAAEGTLPQTAVNHAKALIAELEKEDNE